VKNRETAIFILLCMIGFAAFSALTFFSPQKFTSPDENANAYFINLYSHTGNMHYLEPLNSMTGGYAAPRNASSNHQYVVPSGFPGFISLMGTIATISPYLTPYIIPIFGIMTAVFIFVLVKCLMNTSAALIALFLTLSSAPWFYWSSISFFNNVAATTFLVGGIIFLWLAVEKGALGYYVAGAACFALDHACRLTDAIYLIPLSIFLIISWSKINKKYFLIALFGYIAVLSPTLISNQRLYGNVLSSGYDAQLGIAHKGLIGKAKTFVLPSGFHPNNMLFAASSYLLALQPLIFTLFGIGIVHIFKVWDKNKKSFYIAILALCAWILIYYGSGIYWGSYTYTLDSSFIRYFLPIYLLTIPAAVYSVRFFLKKIYIPIIAVMVIAPISNVIFGRNGLIDMKKRREAAALRESKIINSTDENSVIFTTLADKDIFPSRKVVTYGPVRNINNLKVYKYTTYLSYVENVAKVRPTYILNDRNDIDIDKLTQDLSKKGYRIIPSNKYEDLYKVKVGKHES
jgi:hypothetical protein